MAEPLTTGQKTFNQMLLAEHCWTEKKALKTWNDLAQNGYDMGGDDLHSTLASCNAQLEYCGLEITAISFMNGSKGPSRHYAMINKYHGDDIAKSANKSRMTLSEINLSRLIFEKLVQDGQADRATLINLKKDLVNVEASFTLEKSCKRCKMKSTLRRSSIKQWLLLMVMKTRMVPARNNAAEPPSLAPCPPAWHWRHEPLWNWAICLWNSLAWTSRNYRNSSTFDKIKQMLITQKHTHTHHKKRSIVSCDPFDKNAFIWRKKFGGALVLL
jgi:Nse1 non-SMC component of SMC5-6 complex